VPGIHAGFHALTEQAEHLHVGDLRVPDQQLFPGAFDEGGQDLACVVGAHDEAAVFFRRLVLLAQRIRLEEANRLADRLPVPGDDAEAAALEVEHREVEPVHVELFTVDDHHLAVISRERVPGPRDHHPLLEHPQLELAQAFLTL
jgi:hypothetical protein